MGRITSRVAAAALLIGAMAAAGCGKSAAWQAGHERGYDLEREGYSQDGAREQCHWVTAIWDHYSAIDDLDEHEEYLDGCTQGWKDRHYST